MPIGLAPVASSLKTILAHHETKRSTKEDAVVDARFTAEEHFRRGKEAFAASAFGAAYEQFRAAHELQPSDPRFRSYYGLCLGLVERRFKKALEICKSAAQAQYYDAELLHNLGRLHLAFGFKAEGVAYLRQGIRLDASNTAILEDLRIFGIRRPPVLRFLSRRHPLNRWLGRVRYRLLYGKRLAEALSAQDANGKPIEPSHNG